MGVEYLRRESASRNAGRCPDRKMPELPILWFDFHYKRWVRCQFIILPFEKKRKWRLKPARALERSFSVRYCLRKRMLSGVISRYSLSDIISSPVQWLTCTALPEINRVVRGGRAHIGELFAFGRINRHFFAFGGVADDHTPRIHQFPDQYKAFRAPEDSKARGRALCLRPLKPLNRWRVFDFSGIRTEPYNARGHNSLAFSVNDELVAVAQRAASPGLQTKAAPSLVGD